jgi:hypothetical protein
MLKGWEAALNFIPLFSCFRDSYRFLVKPVHFEELPQIVIVFD